MLPGIESSYKIRTPQPEPLLAVNSHVRKGFMWQVGSIALWSVSNKFIAIKPVKPIDGGNPDEARTVLKDLGNDAVA